MERHGECNNCGWCCQFLSIQRLTIPSRDVSPDSIHFYAMRGGLLDKDQKIRAVLHMFMPCAKHDSLNKKCTDYSDRPRICQVFPSSPDQIEGTPCSHWFEHTEEDGTVERRGGLDSPHPTPPRFGA